MTRNFCGSRWTRAWRWLPLLLAGANLGFADGVGKPADAPASSIPTYQVAVKNRYAHDPHAFTQGLVVAGDVFYESTGLYGQSSVREVEVASGKPLRALQLPPRVFGEGLTLWQDKLIQLSWREHAGFVYDKGSLSFEKSFRYSGEGWGLTHDGSRLIMSDGTSRLRFLDPNTFAETGSLQVTAGGRGVMMLNELEFVKGKIYANIWQASRIAIIDPATGKVDAWIDLGDIAAQHAGNGRPDDVLNGIAYDEKSNRLFVTGKLWNTVYEIEVVP